MFSKQKVELALQNTQRRLYLRFTGILLLCLILIGIVVGTLFFYDLYRVEKKILGSLSVEYQRILKFESDKKLIHVLKANPQRLIENNIAVFMNSPPESAVFIAGDNSLPTDMRFSTYLINDKFWVKTFIFEPFMAIKMQGNSQDFWLVLSNQARYPQAFRQLQMTFLSLIILMLFTSVFIRRLIQKTMSPLITLGNQLDKLSEGSLDMFAEPLVLENKGGLGTISHSVNAAISRLQQVIHTIDATVDAIAHDIRTPLSRITLASERALLNSINNPKGQQELQNALSDCAEYAAQASNMLTALMKLNDELTGKKQLQSSSADITQVLNRVCHWYEEIADEKGIQLHCASQSNAFFKFDADKLSQVLVNLVDNALKYSNTGGEVCLSSSLLANGSLQIQVTDTGIGIDIEHHDLIFKRLYRVDDSRTNAEGYGLGLSLASAMTSNLGGTLSLESSLGKGSTFTILLKS